MKKLISLIAIPMLPLFASAQLQNMDFENWDTESGNKPAEWIWTNSTITEASFAFYHPPVEEAQSNNYAIKLSVWYNYTKDGAVQFAPIDHRPTSLIGFYKYEDNFIYGETNDVLRDTALVSVYLTKFNPTTQSTDTVGVGLLPIGDSVSAYTEFTVNITYTRPEMPDSITVILDPSLCRRYPNRSYSFPDNGLTSFFTVDNLSLVGENTAGLKDIPSKNTLNIFPDPAQDIICFETVSGQVAIFDLTGKQVFETTSGSISSLDISELKKGIYFLRIADNEQTRQARFEKW